MQRYAWLLLITMSVYTASAQTTADSVKSTITKLFVAMKSGDAALLKSCFAENAILQTISINKQDGRAAVKQEAVNDFALLIHNLPKDSADERIIFETVKIDADLASVWTPYNFFYAGRFSHCGVNSFQLVRINGSWKIQYLIDTRRKEHCLK